MIGRALDGVRQAARGFGWRDLWIAIGLDLFFLVFGNAGGYLLVPLTEGYPNAVFDPNKTYLKTIVIGLLGRALPLVFAIRCAEVAVGSGARHWRAYLAALLAAMAFALAFNKVLWVLPIGKVNRAAEHIGRDAWMLLTFGTQAGTAIVMVALWRASQRATQRVRASEAERARDLQRLRSAELLALQARVDPQLLFDALARVGTLQTRNPSAADALLSDLIALLRAMLPRIGSVGSTVEREFSVVQAWLRVTRAFSGSDTSATAGAGGPAVEVQVAADPTALQASLAPMLALPLLRIVLDDAPCARLAWRMEAVAAAGHLTLTLRALGAAGEHAGVDLAPLEFGTLRTRVALLHGDAARLSISRNPPLVTLELPLAFESGSAAALPSGTAAALPSSTAAALPSGTARSAA